MSDTPTSPPPPVPDFTPVPRARTRSDGWTPARQRKFIAALAETGSVKTAAALTGRATVGAYALRRAPGGESFARAWDAALDDGLARIASAAYSRVTDGVATPIMFRGKQVAEKRTYSDKLTMFMLRHHSPQQYGANTPLRPGTKSPSRIQQEETGQSSEQGYAEAMATKQRIAAKLRAARNMFLMSIADDPAKCAAWDLLCPKANWEYARAGRDRPTMPDGDLVPLLAIEVEERYPNMLQPDFIVPIASGFLPSLSDPDHDDTVDPLANVIASIARCLPEAERAADDEEPAEGDEDLTPEAGAAELRERLGLPPFVPPPAAEPGEGEA